MFRKDRAASRAAPA